MCGLCGYLYFPGQKAPDDSVLPAMLKTLALRGPDGEGLWRTDSVAFGHSRLSIIDIQGGKQPMIHTEGDATWAIVFNGEIYNYREIRGELESAGQVFQSASDTEVLLKAYVAWGERCVERLKGIFAFALWSSREQKLLLVRDPLGVKPLYYSITSSGIVFGSEQKALLQHPDVSPTMDARGLSRFFPIHAPFEHIGHGIFRDIKEVPAAHMLVFSLNGKSYLKSYWQLQALAHEDSLELTLDTLADKMQAIVTQQMVSDVPLGSLLSGGLDSSIVTLLASQSHRQNGGDNFNTFSIAHVGVDNQHATDIHVDDDLPWASLLAKNLGLIHHEIPITPENLLSHVSNAVIANELPMPDLQMDIGLYLLCKQVKKSASVVLSGEGADELFGGYPWFMNQSDGFTRFPWVAMYEKIMKPNLVIQLLKKAAPSFFSPLARDIASLVDYEGYLREEYEAALAVAPRLQSDTAQEAYQRLSIFLNLRNWLPLMLRRNDRLSMAAGLEVRVPFCDHGLVQYAWNIPWKLKKYGGMEKGILRHAFARSLPEEIAFRKKSSFPVSRSSVYEQGIRDWATGLLSDPNEPVTPLVNAIFFKKLIQGKIKNIPPYAQLRLLERLVQSNQFFKHFKVELCL